MNEIYCITVEKLADKNFEIVVDFGCEHLLQIGIDNTDGDIDAGLLDRVMEAVTRSYKIGFKDLYMLRQIIKGLMRRVM